MIKRWKRKAEGGHLDGSRPLDLGKTQVPTANPVFAIPVLEDLDRETLPKIARGLTKEIQGAPIPILVAELSRRLAEYDLTISEKGLYGIVERWIRAMKDDTPESRRATSERIRTDPAGVATELVETVLFSIAEERPGTDPFSHEPTIPTPVTVILNVSYALSSCADLAIVNAEYETARDYIDCLGQLAYISADSSMSLPDDGNQVVQVATPDTESGTAVFQGSIILTPQPALAFCARKMENVANLLESGEWRVGSEKEDDNALITLKNLRRAAAVLRDLNLQYGQHEDAGRES